MLDINVLVSAMLTGGGAPDQVLHLVLQGAATLLADSRIFAEYDEVTARPVFRFDPVERLLLLATLEQIAEPVVAAPLKLTLPDPEDRIFVEVALAGAADAIVTGNTRHFPSHRGMRGVLVLTPRQFVERMRR